MQKFGIDISRWQGDFDIGRAMNSEGVEFVIIKAAGGDAGLYTDRQFTNNYNKCERYCMDKGAYFFGQAMTVDAARQEAEYFLNVVKGKKFEYPLFYDVEAKMLQLDKRTLTDVVKTFCSIVEGAGYWIGIYSSASHFNSSVYDEELARYSHWVAAWGTNKPALSKGGETQMWQFGGETNKIRTNKINGQTVDQDYCYVDYPAKIKAAGLNGYSKSTEPVITRKSNEEIAREVIEGRWGNGQERKDKLAAAGYDYSQVQSIVNNLLR